MAAGGAPEGSLGTGWQPEPVLLYHRAVVLPYRVLSCQSAASAYCPSQAADAASCSPSDAPTPFVPSAAANVCIYQAVVFHFASCFKEAWFQDPYSRPR